MDPDLYILPSGHDRETSVAPANAIASKVAWERASSEALVSTNYEVASENLPRLSGYCTVERL